MRHRLAHLLLACACACCTACATQPQVTTLSDADWITTVKLQVGSGLDQVIPETWMAVSQQVCTIYHPTSPNEAYLMNREASYYLSNHGISDSRPVPAGNVMVNGYRMSPETAFIYAAIARYCPHELADFEWWTAPSAYLGN